MKNKKLSIVVGSALKWHLDHTAKAYESRGQLSQVVMADKCTLKDTAKYKRCFVFHLAMKLVYWTNIQLLVEKSVYRFFFLWKWWAKRQQFEENVNVVHCMAGFGTEFFENAKGKNILKVVEFPNSHPGTFFSFWKRECDIWDPKSKVPIPDWFFARMTREIEMADLVVVPSQFVWDSMEWNRVNMKKCFMNPFGADLSVFTPDWKRPKNPTFISVGTICLRKGYPYLFRAFEKVKKQIPEAELICVGLLKDDFAKENENWKHLYTHKQRVQHPELAKLYQNSNALLIPSLEEGFARVILESLSVTLPVIASHESGASTIVEHEKHGLIINPKNVNEVADAMIRLIEDEELNNAMSKSIKEIRTAFGSWQDYGDRMIEEFETRLSAGDE